MYMTIEIDKILKKHKLPKLTPEKIKVHVVLYLFFKLRYNSYNILTGCTMVSLISEHFHHPKQNPCDY